MNRESVLLQIQPEMARGYPARVFFSSLVTAVILAVYLSPGLFSEFGELVQRILWNVRSLSATYPYTALGVAAVVGPFPLVTLWLSTYSRELIVTSQRARKRTGIIRVSSTEMELRSIRNIQVEQSIMERILGVGTLRLSSAGQSGVELTIRAVDNPKEIRDLILRQLDQEEQRASRAAYE
jgi:uncharacterized membrane protein YdbT with pleckstrin-like domain